MAYVNTTRSTSNGIFDRFVAMTNSVTVWVQRRRVYEQTVSELNHLTDRELSDLGISRLSIQDIARMAAFGK